MQVNDNITEIKSGNIENIIYRNDKNGYTVFEISGDSEDFIAVGIVPYVQKGEYVELHGRFCTHPDYGYQFLIDKYEKKSFKTNDSIIKYLSSGLFKGIGPKLAKRIVDKFGISTIEIIKNEPENLTKIKGINLDRANEFCHILNNKDKSHDLNLFLGEYNINQATILKIEEYFGNDALKKIKENPYTLTKPGLAVRFPKADEIALSLGFDKHSILRIQSAMQSVLINSLVNGNTFMFLDRCLEETSNLVSFILTRETLQLNEILNNQQIKYIKENDIVMLKIAYNAENNISKFIISKTKNAKIKQSSTNVSNEIVRLCGSETINYDEFLIESIIKCLTNPITIITGGPGTGKTTLIKIMCNYIKNSSKKVLLAAPTGRAAKRMQETTGFEAKTIHRLLELLYRSDEDDYNLIFARTKDNPIDADLLIIDEASMLDVFLMKYLLEAVPSHCNLIFVGDKNQLPSVGAGNVLKDMMASNKILTVELKKVYRQEKGSLIVQNSHKILNGEYPEFDQTINSEFMFISKSNDFEKANSVVLLCTNILKQKYNIDPMRDIQILTPTRKGPCGTYELNKALQLSLNNHKYHQKNNNELFYFKINDKVMQIRNNYELKWTSINDSSLTGTGIFNGDMGSVISINTDKDTLMVLFDDERIVEYTKSNIDELELAYTITVHKSQGSEYPVVILVLPDSPKILMTRNLLYTAISRAKEKLFLVTDKSILSNMIQNNCISDRNTMLCEFLSDEQKSLLDT